MEDRVPQTQIREPEQNPHELISSSATQIDVQNDVVSQPAGKIIKETHGTSTSYRPDIDGLRTIAVGIVVIFHAWPETLTGGFIGVDVFFVISGYLITQILVKENLKGTFTYYNFYNRRVKRIYPALIIVLLFVLYMGLQYSEVRHLEMLTRTMAASTVFGANIEVLTYDQGYWDADVKTNPLLHLWSLGVEQQFYIFWPFLIAILLTKFNSRAFQLLTWFAVLSFVLNTNAAFISPKFDFYFPLCRFWQMAIGGLLAIKAVKIANLFYAHALSTVALITILVASYFLSQVNLYPGWWALFPTLAAAGIIGSGAEAIVNKHILSNKVMVFIGKISYSLYLWHWPLLVFSRLLYPEGNDQLFGQTWFIVLISFIFSLLSYFLVQNPIRFKKQKLVFYALLIIMLLIGITSIIVHENSSRIKGEDNQSQEFNPTEEDISDTNDKQTQTVEQNTQKPTQPVAPDDTKKIDKKEDKKSLKKDEKKEDKTDPEVKKPTPIQPVQPEQPSRPRTPREQYQLDMVPRQQDYYEKDGRRIPNWSKSRNRTYPTVDKIKLIRQKFYWYQVILDNKINRTSKYYRPKLPNKTLQYQVANEGRQKLVFLVGDSYAHYTAYRFGKLYEDAKKMNRTNQFPTFVALLFSGTTLTEYEDNFNFIKNFIEEFKPDRILFSYYWQNYRTYHGFEDYPKNKKNLSDDYFYENIGYFLKMVKISIEQGSQVTTTSFQPRGEFYQPWRMYTPKSVIDKNIQPFKLSEVNATYLHLANYFESEVKKAGANLIHLIDHSCWNDSCEVLSPSGYPVFSDSGHWTYDLSRNWMTSVDSLLDFKDQSSEKEP